MKRIKSRARFKQRMAPQSPVNWPFVKPDGTQVDRTLLTRENTIVPRLRTVILHGEFSDIGIKNCCKKKKKK